MTSGKPMTRLPSLTFSTAELSKPVRFVSQVNNFNLVLRNAEAHA